MLIEINDDGPGVPLEVQSRIFDPFFTTKEVGKGTGLGLSVAYALVKEHAGRIWLRSEASGTSFYVELPVTARAGDAAPASAPVERRCRSKGYKGRACLVVEDEPALAMAVSEALVRRRVRRRSGRRRRGGVDPPRRAALTN